MIKTSLKEGVIKHFEKSRNHSSGIIEEIKSLTKNSPSVSYSFNSIIFNKGLGNSLDKSTTLFTSKKFDKLKKEDI